jgi:hypothetical protein
LDFSHLHLYQCGSDPNASALLAAEIQKVMPGIVVEVRPPFHKYWNIGRFEESCHGARIHDVKQPFDRQPSEDSTGMELYDGFVLQGLLRAAIAEEESGLRHVHVVMTDKLVCTFDEGDWRYHARTVVCGSPSIISSAGIVEAPAKPKEYYILSRGFADPQILRKQFAGRFIEYGDKRINAALLVYLYQSLFFFLTEGDPFCDRQDCILYNSHWQEELIRILANPGFCSRHATMLEKFSGKQS